MANQRVFTKKQVVYSKKRKVLVESYLTKKGLRLKLQGADEEVLKKYRKNLYHIDPTAVPIKTITHSQNHRRVV